MLANLLRLCQIKFGPSLVADVKVKSSEAIVAGEEELGFAGLLGMAKRFLVASQSLSVVAMALVDLAQHDQGHCQVVEQSQPSIQIDGLLCGLDTFGLAAVSQRAVGDREVRV